VVSVRLAVEPLTQTEAANQHIAPCPLLVEYVIGWGAPVGPMTSMKAFHVGELAHL
jgi:hypothetical protein